MFAYICVCTTCASCLRRPAEGLGSPGTEIVDIFELPFRCLKPSQGPLGEHQAWSHLSNRSIRLREEVLMVAPGFLPSFLRGLSSHLPPRLIKGPGLLAVLSALWLFLLLFFVTHCLFCPQTPEFFCPVIPHNMSYRQVTSESPSSANISHLSCCFLQCHQVPTLSMEEVQSRIS